MSKKSITVANINEVYRNPLAELVAEACKYDSRIILESGTSQINAKSIMGIMALNPVQGMEIDIVANGEDEEAALSAIEQFLTRS